MARAIKKYLKNLTGKDFRLIKTIKKGGAKTTTAALPSKPIIIYYCLVAMSNTLPSASTPSTVGATSLPVSSS